MLKFVENPVTMTNQMKSILLLISIFLNLWPLSALAAAPTNMDSLLHALEQTPEPGRERAELLAAISLAFRELAPEAAIRYGQELISLAGTLNAAELVWQGHMVTGVAYASKGDDFDGALRHFIDALDMAKQYDTKEWKLRQVKSRINIAGVHWATDNIERALEYTRENIRQLENMEEPLTLADAYRSLALMHRSAQQFDSTFIYLNRAIGIYREIEAETPLSFSRMTLAHTYEQSGKHALALRTFREVLPKAYENKDTILLMDITVGMAQSFASLSRADSALHYARMVVRLAEQKKLLPYQIDGYEALANAFALAGQADSALYYQRGHSRLLERKYDEDQATALQELEVAYQAREKARENELLRKQYNTIDYQNGLLIVSTILLLILLLTAAAFYYRLIQRKKELEKLNQEVVSINGKLKAIMNEKQHMALLIAHDIRNPLSLIQFDAHALANSAVITEEERHQMLAEIEQATKEIDKATLRIMEIENRFEEQLSIQNITFDLLPALKDSIRNFTPLARRKSIQLLLHSPQNEAFIQADPKLARHIIDNLLSNAVKYSPQHSKIEVSLAKEKKFIRVAVKDEGQGLPAEEQRLVFERGQRLSPQPTAGEASRGEGLYLTRRYAEAMGGKVAVSSEPGEGSVFTVAFPKAG